MDFSRYDTVFIVSYEAGGAEILSSLARALQRYVVCADGPAVRIFNAKLPGSEARILEDIDHLGPNDLVLTGTSWKPNLERQAIVRARHAGVFCCSVLDHWVNFVQRFYPAEQWSCVEAPDPSVLPDRIITCDRYAYAAAKAQGFPEERLIEIENPFFKEFVAEYKSAIPQCPGSDAGHILYVSEPVVDDLKASYGDPDYWGYSEYDVVREFTSCVSHTDAILGRVRLHPNESRNKYDNWIDDSSRIELSTGTLQDDLLWADAVIGVESMALVLASLVGKRVYSWLPERATKRCSLPHDEIVKVKDMIDAFTATQSTRA